MRPLTGVSVLHFGLFVTEKRDGNLSFNSYAGISPIEKNSCSGGHRSSSGSSSSSSSNSSSVVTAEVVVVVVAAAAAAVVVATNADNIGSNNGCSIGRLTVPCPHRLHLPDLFVQYTL